jgi:hypothetical protein
LGALPQALQVLAFHGLPREVAPWVRRPESFVERCNAAGLLPYEVRVTDLVSPLRGVDDHINVIGRTDGLGSGVGDEQPGGSTAEKDDTGAQRPQSLSDGAKELEVLIGARSHDASSSRR